MNCIYYMFISNTWTKLFVWSICVMIYIQYCFQVLEFYWSPYLSQKQCSLSLLASAFRYLALPYLSQRQLSLSRLIDRLSNVVHRFDIRICNALFRSLKKFSGRTVGFITVVTAVVITITLITDRNASAVGGAGKLGWGLSWGAGVICLEIYCAIILFGGR